MINYLRNSVVSLSGISNQALHPSEMAALLVTDIHLEAGTIRIRGTGKTKTTELSLRPNQVLLFYKYIHVTRPKLLGSGRTAALLVGIWGEPMKGEDITKYVKRSYKDLYPCSTERYRPEEVATLVAVVQWYHPFG